jgi:hypothetical protein
MTEEYAVILSYRVWCWLWQNPGKRKEDCPWWKLLETMCANCPCCAYFYAQLSHCRTCVLAVKGTYSCANGAWSSWSFDHTDRAASGYIASKLRRYARRKNFNFELEIVA